MLDEVKVEVVDLTDDSEEIKVKMEDLTPFEKNHAVSDSDPHESSRAFTRNRDKFIEKAVEEIRNGHSLVVVASYYGIPREVIYNKLISRSLPREDEILTHEEEESLIKWIVNANKNNTMVFKQQLLRKVGKLQKVMDISLFFAKSKFGLKWYYYFMKTHPEIYENHGLLMPVNKVLHPTSLLMSHEGKNAVELLQDFKKDENTSFSSVRKDTYVQKANESCKEDHNQEDYYFSCTSNKLSHDYCKDEPTLKIVDIIKDEPVSDDTRLESGNFSSETNQDNSYKSLTNVKKRCKPPGKTPICHLCVKSFCNFQKLKRHMLSIHKPRNHRLFVCFNCNKYFSSRMGLQMHTKNAHKLPT